ALLRQNPVNQESIRTGADTRPYPPVMSTPTIIASPIIIELMGRVIEMKPRILSITIRMNH
ncbi:MAG: hypothetical protein NTV15_03275, partial [Candidatus Bathyarchaeota archaeon]|nr:hypothetical protein [Candidatus Bathyarchaeota archaeon]